MSEPLENIQTLPQTINIPYVAPISMPTPPVNLTAFSGEEDENILDWFERFESVATNFNWNAEQMYITLPTYLQGTAKRCYNFIISAYTPDDKKPTDYNSLKRTLIRDLCPSDYRSFLSQQLHNTVQQPGQSTTSFIYQIQDLCLRIDAGTPEIFILSMIKEKLLPQIKYGIALQNPENLHQLIEAARLAERAAFSCNSVFIQKDLSNQNNLATIVNTMQEHIKHLAMKVDNLVTQRDTCNYCKKNGHVESACWQKLRDGSNQNHASKQSQPISGQNNTNGNIKPHFTNAKFANRERNYHKNHDQLNSNWRDRPSTSGYNDRHSFRRERGRTPGRELRETSPKRRSPGRPRKRPISPKNRKSDKSKH